jgi:hypothetical protein
MPLNLGDLGVAPLGFARLPKLDVAGSSPVARSFASREIAAGYEIAGATMCPGDFSLWLGGVA